MEDRSRFTAALPALTRGRFTVRQVVHEGVLRAEDVLTGRNVLLKHGAVEALRTEAALSLSLTRHPSFRRVLWLERFEGAVGAQMTLAIEEAEGTFLHQRAALKKRLASHRAKKELPDAIEAVGVKLLRALHALHTRGFAHGDLKPEHVLIDDENAVRLIDLGLSTRLGQTARGGTHGYLAPELLEGAPMDIPAELFAFGRCLESCFEAQTMTPRLGKLIKACTQTSRKARPPSVEAALAALGALPWPRDRLAIDFTEAPLLGPCLEALEQARGDVVLVHGAAGAGRTHLAASLEDRLFQASLERAHVHPLRFDARTHTWSRLPLCVGVPSHDDRARRIERGALRAAEQGLVFIVDAADAGSEDAQLDLLTVARALRAKGKGALVVIGAAEASPLNECATHVHTLARWSASDLKRRTEALGLRLRASDAREVLAEADGRAGAISRVLDAQMTHPEARLRDLIREEKRARQSAPASRKARVEAAQHALDEDAPREAIAMLGTPHGDAERRLLATAYARAGAITEALDLQAAITQPSSGDSLHHARLLERSSRFHEAIAIAKSLPAKGDFAAARGAILATSWLAVGSLEEAMRATESALQAADEIPAKIRLLTLRSDAALRMHARQASLDAAEQAHVLAKAHGDEGLLALVLARLGALHGLGGQRTQALTFHRDALLHAEQAGDVVALPPYLMNVATAHHALGEYADALAMYERAAELAERLGRLASLAASLVNLAALHQTMRADEEATHLLDRAESVARSATSGLHVAQVALIRAELLAAGGSFDAAITSAEEAQRAFLTLSATRQALEASLVRAEIAVLSRADDAAARIEALDRDALAEAGLLPRADLARIEWLLAHEDFPRARRLAEDLAASVALAGPIEVHVRVLGVVADVHAALSTGAFDVHDAAYRKRLGDLAAQTPEALRERLVTRMSANRRTRAKPMVSGASGTEHALGPVGERLFALMRRTLLENDEDRLLEAALDEAIVASGAERGFLLRKLSQPHASHRKRDSEKTEVAFARNLDRDSIRNPRFRFSRSVADRVLASGEPLVTASAAEDPALHGARSIAFLGLRSILCVPVRAPSGIVGALYLDHRFERGRFDESVLRTVEAFADVVGLSIENARLHRASEAKVRRLEEESAHAHEDAERLSTLLAMRDAEPTAPQGGIVGESPAIRAALSLSRKVARSDLPVLIAGESGTGKELFARFIHDMSLRHEKPFVAINCGALPEPLLESELFGHVRGAFTGAHRDHPGFFRAAEGGTLFLDEVGEMPAAMQVRLLRVLQEHEVRPVGGRQLIKVNVRVVCATHRDLQRAVEEGRFRQDLYFRLAGIRIDVPPLRERVSDIPLLARTFLARRDFAGLEGTPKTLSRAALTALISHPFPGNVRELEQSLRRGAALAEGEVIEPADLGLAPLRAHPSRREPMRELEVGQVEHALQSCGGNRTAAAKQLDVSRATLHRFLANHPSRVEGKRGRPRLRRV